MHFYQDKNHNIKKNCNIGNFFLFLLSLFHINKAASVCQQSRRGKKKLSSEQNKEYLDRFP